MGPLDDTGSTSTAFEQALGEKACGNTHFAAGDYARARDSYDLALSFLRDGFVATKEANELAAKVHTNAAAACIKLGDPLGAIEHCQLAIAIDPRNVKALFRKAESLKSLGRYSEALAQLERALLLEENNEEIKESMDECEDLIDFQDHGGAFESRHDFDPPGVDADKEEQQLPEEALAAAHAKLEELTEEILGGRATVEEHVMLNHGEAKFGKFDIKDAFFSPSNLSSALEFVRGQHFTSSAKFAVSEIKFVPHFSQLALTTTIGFLLLATLAVRRGAEESHELSERLVGTPMAGGRQRNGWGLLGNAREGRSLHLVYSA